MMFLLYDGRAITGDEDEATVMDAAHSEGAARRAGETIWEGTDGIWFEYKEHGSELSGGRPRYDLPPYSENQCRAQLAPKEGEE